MTVTTTDIWEQFGGRLRGFILKRVDDPQDADDILQEVFLKIHTRLNTLEKEDRLLPWIYSIARNTILDHYRARRPTTPLPDDLAVEPEPLEAEPEARLAAGLQNMIQACLPQDYQQALLLTEIQGMKQADLAAELGLSLSGAKSRVQRGRQLLHKALVDCCQFHFDRTGQLVDYYPHPQDCGCGAC